MQSEEKQGGERLKQDLFVLGQDEGIYIRNKQTGQVRAVIGQSYTLLQDEELWDKLLLPEIENLLIKDPFTYYESSETAITTRKEKWKVITYRVPDNAVVQVNDHKERKTRVVFGPELVFLAPNEQFTVLSLSGGTPKKQNFIKSFCLFLDPDVSSDIISIETVDHARLSVKLSYNWYFDTKNRDQVEVSKLFSVPDFIGTACRAITSIVKDAVSSVSFEDLIKNPNSIVREAFFGFDENNKIRKTFEFPENNLVITSIDISLQDKATKSVFDYIECYLSDIQNCSIEKIRPVLPLILRHYDVKRIDSLLKNAFNLFDQEKLNTIPLFHLKDCMHELNLCFSEEQFTEICKIFLADLLDSSTNAKPKTKTLKYMLNNTDPSVGFQIKFENFALIMTGVLVSGKFNPKQEEDLLFAFERIKSNKNRFFKTNDLIGFIRDFSEKFDEEEALSLQDLLRTIESNEIINYKEYVKHLLPPKKMENFKIEDPDDNEECILKRFGFSVE